MTTDWDQRQLCPDGGCTGMIGRDGTCQVCGRAAPNWGDERRRGRRNTDEVDAEAAAAPPPAPPPMVDLATIAPGDDGGCVPEPRPGWRSRPAGIAMAVAGVAMLVAAFALPAFGTCEGGLDRDLNGNMLLLGGGCGLFVVGVQRAVLGAATRAPRTGARASIGRIALVLALVLLAMALAVLVIAAWRRM